MKYKDENGKEFALEAELITSGSKIHHLFFYDTDLLQEFDFENELFCDGYRDNYFIYKLLLLSTDNLFNVYLYISCYSRYI